MSFRLDQINEQSAMEIPHWLDRWKKGENKEVCQTLYNPQMDTYWKCAIHYETECTVHQRRPKELNLNHRHEWETQIPLSKSQQVMSPVPKRQEEVTRVVNMTSNVTYLKIVRRSHSQSDGGRIIPSPIVLAKWDVPPQCLAWWRVPCHCQVISFVCGATLSL